MKVDLSPKAVTTRLQRVSQLRRLCLSLMKAGAKQRQSAPTEPDAAK
jgi:hypothetical protein